MSVPNVASILLIDVEIFHAIYKILTCGWCRRKRQEITTIFSNPPSGHCGYLHHITWQYIKHCQDVSLKAKNVNLLVTMEEKLRIILWGL